VIKVPPPSLSWLKSTASIDDTGDCVEVASTDNHVWVRNSRNSNGPVLRFTLNEWRAFLVRIRSGQFDCSEPTDL